MTRCCLAVFFLCIGVSSAVADPPPAVKHPNLLLNREEIEQVKARIKGHEWAAHLLARVKELADEPGRVERIPREAALVYVLTGEKRYGEAVRRALVGGSRYTLSQLDKFDPRLDPNLAPAWGPWANWAWAYDLTYELYTEEERQLVERMLRRAAQSIMDGLKVRSTTPNLVFEMHWKVGLIGFVLGDRTLIDWGLNDPGVHGPSHGGFYQVLDTMIKDKYFWGEAPIYALHYDIHGMLALAEAALHYDGTDLYHHVSKKSGASIKTLIDGYLRMAYPREKTGIEGGSVRMATFGDGSTSYSPKGELQDTFLVNPVSGTFGEPTLSGELEVAYKRYKDPGYAWLLSLNRRRDQYIGSAGQGHSRPIWGYVALTHGEVLPEKITPPPAPCGIYPSQGFAMLRSDESPRYWDAGGLAAVLRLGALVGHGHKDYFHLILHGKGRLLYPDLNIIQYEPTFLHWTHEGIAHNTLLVDHRSPRPGPSTTRHDFTPDGKFFAITGGAFENVTQTRAVLMTREYLADIFRARDTQGRERTFDWVLHGLGRLYPSDPAAYQPSQALVPYYWWVDNERSRRTDRTWQADWIQHSGGVAPGVQRFGKEWFEQNVGVRMTMLGGAQTEVFAGEGPITDGPPYHRREGDPEGSSPLVLARRRAFAVTFSAVHEPYEKRAALHRIHRLQETDDAIGVGIEADSFSDRVLIAFDADREHTLRAGGEAFAFRNYGYLRLAGDRLNVRGEVRAFRLKAPATAQVSINGEARKARRDGDYLVFGEVPVDAAPAPEKSGQAEASEPGAALHYHWMPEEIHLRAGGEKEATLHVRCVGRGEARGTLRLQTPREITVEPAAVELPNMTEGEARTVRLRFKAAAGAASALHSIRVVPDRGTPAAAGVLPVSVGVVMSEDIRTPLLAQWVVRAPGYTARVDQYSGICYHLLDADGNRRHGYIHNTNFCFGIGAAQREGKWLFRYGTPSRFVWDSPNTLTIGSASDLHDARLRYTFHEDRIILGLIPPTNPTAEQTMWLGNFDFLGTPRHAGTQKRPHDPITADWFFFPHPRHRQGVLLTFAGPIAVQPRGGAVSFPMRVGREVALRFADEEELKSILEKASAAKPSK
jgi:hypothetical protein